MSYLLRQLQGAERCAECDANEVLLNIVPELCVIHEREEALLRQAREQADLYLDSLRRVGAI